MVYQGATGLYHFVINVIPFISNSVSLGQYSLKLHTFFNISYKSKLNLISHFQIKV